MIISQQQVQKAVEYLRTPSGSAAASHSGTAYDAVSPEFLERVHKVIDECPETRADRVEHARACVQGSAPSSDEVAEKMIGRIVSDSLR